MSSAAARLAALPIEQRRALLSGLDAEALQAIEFEWSLWARPDQLPPPGDWRTWLLLGGRGSGKTRSSAEWVRAEIEVGRRRQIAIIGPTADSIRRDQIEGPSGILRTASPYCKPSYEPSTRRVVWDNGAVAHLFSSEEPDRLRGPNLDGAWCDEITSWSNDADTWSNLQLALRVAGPLGHQPAAIISTTPKPRPLLKKIIEAPTTVITRSRTLDNSANLAPSALEELLRQYGGTTLGRQELDAELILDAEGALWTRQLIDACRMAPCLLPPMRRIVVAIDPAGGSAKTNDETGIIVAGIDHAGTGYILEDRSGRMTPNEWASRAVDAYQNHFADRIVAEANFGGAMVESTIRSVNPNVPVKMVRASKGKAVRAEPIVSLYEQRRICHVGFFPTLEDQLCAWNPAENGPSPDRLDALVWALSELMAEKEAIASRRVHINLMGR